MKLFVDDIRKCPEGWQLARTITEAIRILATQEVEELSLDHDICHVSDKPGIQVPIVCPENYSAVAWYVTVMPKDRVPKKITLHSANDWGARNMSGILAGADIKSEIRTMHSVCTKESGETVE